MDKHFMIHYNRIRYSTNPSITLARELMDEIIEGKTKNRNPINAKNITPLNIYTITDLIKNPEIKEVLEEKDHSTTLDTEQKKILDKMLSHERIQLSHNSKYNKKFNTFEYHMQLAAICLSIEQEACAQEKVSDITSKLYPDTELFVVGNIAPQYIAAFIQKDDNITLSGIFKELSFQSAIDLVTNAGANLKEIIGKASIIYYDSSIRKRIAI